MKNETTYWVLVRDQSDLKGNPVLKAGSLVECIDTARLLLPSHMRCEGSSGFIAMVHLKGEEVVYAIDAVIAVLATDKMWLYTEDDRLINVLNGNIKPVPSEIDPALKHEVVVRVDGEWIQVLRDGNCKPLAGHAIIKDYRRSKK